MSTQSGEKQDEAIEKIVIKPSTELTADEYEHFNEETANFGVHTFTTNDEDGKSSADLLTETLKKNGYEIKKKNAHSIDDDNFFEVQKRIVDDSKDSRGLILFISGISEDDGTMTIFDGQQRTSIYPQEIVTTFNSYTSEGLKNKPKIFIFHMRPRTRLRMVQADSLMHVRYAYSYDLTYDTPGEADMLIVYKHSKDDSSKDFITQLCDKVNQHGKEEDIVSLVTSLNVENREARPLIISTLTKKFYITNSEHRGHHYHLHRHHIELNQQLEGIKNKLSEMTALKKKITMPQNAGASGGARRKLAASNTSTTKSVPGKDSNRMNPSKRSTLVMESDSSWSSINGTGRGSGTLSSSKSQSGLRADANKNKETNGSRNRLSSIRSNPSGLDGRIPWR